MALFQINTGYTTFSHELARHRFVETSRTEIPGRPWPKRRGYHQWQNGDHASLHLDAPLLWTLVEVRIIGRANLGRYRVVITRFDGTLQRLAGLAIGDELTVGSRCFFSLWAPGQTREDGEGSQKIYEEGSTRPPNPLPGSERLH